MSKYHVYLKGYGFVKTKYLQKNKIYGTKTAAQRRAKIERERWSKKPNYVKIVKIK